MDSAGVPRTFSVGDKATLSREVGDDVIRQFAEASGDYNPIHLDDAYAANTYFHGRIAHGMLAASLISAVLGTILPGSGAIYLSQQLQFRVPVRPGDTITAQVTVTAWDGERGRITLQTQVVNQEGVLVVTGEARLVLQEFLPPQ